jgi:hypothetical protein
VDRLVAVHGALAYDAVAVKRFFNSPVGSPSTSPTADIEALLWLGAAAAQREALLELWRSGDIGEDVLNRLEREIDLTEVRLAPRD